MDRRSVITIGAIAFYGIVLFTLYGVFKEMPSAMAMADIAHEDVMPIYIITTMICGCMFACIVTISSILSGAILDYINDEW